MSHVVLVPHDLTDGSDPALDAVIALQVPVRALHVVHVLERSDPTVPSVFWPVDEGEARALDARKALRSRLAGTAFEHAAVHSRIGDPATAIVELASELGATLIVISSHSRTGLRRLVLGSVAEQVARLAPCPVVVLPAGARPPE